MKARVTFVFGYGTRKKMWRAADLPSALTAEKRYPHFRAHFSIDGGKVWHVIPANSTWRADPAPPGGPRKLGLWERLGWRGGMFGRSR